MTNRGSCTQQLPAVCARKTRLFGTNRSGNMAENVCMACLQKDPRQPNQPFDVWLRGQIRYDMICNRKEGIFTGISRNEGVNNLKSRTFKQERYSRSSAACELFKKAKTKSIHILAGFGQKHRILRYPVMAALTAFLFVHNMILYSCRRLKAGKSVAKGAALVLTAVLVFLSADTAVFAADPAAAADNRKLQII